MAKGRKATGSTGSSDSKTSPPTWIPIVVAVIMVVGSIAGAYISATISTGKSFETKFEALKAEVKDTQTKSQEVAKQVAETQGKQAKLSEQLDDLLKNSDFVTKTKLEERIKPSDDGFIVEGNHYKRHTLKICADEASNVFATTIDRACDSLIAEGKQKYSKTIKEIDIYTLGVR